MSRILLSGIDTLHLHVVLPLKSGVANQLAALKRAALEIRHAGDEAEVPFTVAGVRLVVKPHGARAGPFFADCEDVALTVNPDGGGLTTFPTAVLELRALWLWRVGYVKACEKARAMLAELTEGCTVTTTAAPCNGAVGSRKRHAVEVTTDPVQVTRIDLAADFEGWVPYPEQRDSFVARAKRRTVHKVEKRGPAFRKGEELEEHELHEVEEHHQGRAFTGFSFGGGAIGAGLYFKSLEIKTSRKLWFWPLWKRAGWNGDAPVWRLEFRLRRAFLREAAVMRTEEDGTVRGVLSRGVFCSLTGCLKHLKSLWRHLSTKWLSLRQARTGKSRQRFAPEWRSLSQGATFETSPEEAEVFRIKGESESERTTAQLAGYLKRHVICEWQRAVRDGRRLNHLTSGEGIRRAIIAAERYHKEKRGHSLAQAVDVRRAALVAQVWKSVSHYAPEPGYWG